MLLRSRELAEDYGIIKEEIIENIYTRFVNYFQKKHQGIEDVFEILRTVFDPLVTDPDLAKLFKNKEVR